MMSPEEILRELHQIEARLAELAPDDFGERARLRSRQHELRALGRRLPAREVSREALEDRLRALEARRDEIQSHHLSYRLVGGGGPGGGEFDAPIIRKMNEAIDRAQGLEGIEREIADLRRRLEELGSP